jgi:hypothetical protein
MTITAGNKPTSDGRGGVHVPKKDLVSVMQVLLQTHRLRVTASLPLARVLVQELQTFKVKITDAGNETFGAWRERDHDDLVLAVSLALWLAENTPEPYTGPLVYWPQVPFGDEEESPAQPKTWLQEALEQLDREEEERNVWRR